MFVSWLLPFPCRPIVSKIESAAENQKHDREAELARNLRKADYEQVIAKVNADMDVLESQVSPEVQKQQEHALDMKYLRERQLQLGCFYWWWFIAIGSFGVGQLDR